MTVRQGTIATATVIIVVGLAIGGWLGVLARGSGDGPRLITLARPIRTAPASKPPPSITTDAPTALPAPPIPAPTVAATTGAETLRGTWQVDEANVQVGTIVWVGEAMQSGDSIVLDVQKESVAGRSATRCERQTDLRAAFAIGAGPQSVPYRETNCAGTVSTGEVRVQSFSRDGASFSGSFWQNGVLLGHFTARKR